MKYLSNALFFILLLVNSTISTGENILELINQTPEGKELLETINLQIASQGEGLDKGKIEQALSQADRNAQNAVSNHDKVIKRNRASCKHDLTILNSFASENRKHEYTITRHLNSNEHASKKNQQYIDRSEGEWNSYESLKNLVIANKANWEKQQKGNLQTQRKVISLLKKAKNIIEKVHKISQGQSFVEIQGEYINSLSEVRVDFANTFDTVDGLRPIISNLLETMNESKHISKASIRQKVIRILKKIIKAIRNNIDEIEAQIARADALFNALLANIGENKIRIKKLQGRLVAEKKSLNNRQAILRDSKNRAHEITELSKKAFDLRRNQCHNTKIRNIQLKESAEKTKNLVAQTREVIAEGFGHIKTFFIEKRNNLGESENKDNDSD